MGIFNIPTPEELKEQEQKDLDDFINNFDLDLSQEELNLFSKIYGNALSVSKNSKEMVPDSRYAVANVCIKSLLLDFYILNELSANNRNANSIDEKLSILIEQNKQTIEQNNQIIEFLKKTKNQ